MAETCAQPRGSVYPYSGDYNRRPRLAYISLVRNYVALTLSDHLGDHAGCISHPADLRHWSTSVHGISQRWIWQPKVFVGWYGVYKSLLRQATALVQFVSMIVAAYFLDQTANNRVDEVAAIADDLEVKKADDEAAYLTTNATTKWWHDTPFTPSCCSRLPSNVSLPAAIFFSSFQVCASLITRWQIQLMTTI